MSTYYSIECEATMICDVEHCSWESSEIDSYDDENHLMARLRRRAEKDGWVTTDNGAHICPECASRGITDASPK